MVRNVIDDLLRLSEDITDKLNNGQAPSAGLMGCRDCCQQATQLVKRIDAPEQSERETGSESDPTDSEEFTA